MLSATCVGGVARSYPFGLMIVQMYIRTRMHVSSVPRVPKQKAWTSVLRIASKDGQFLLFGSCKWWERPSIFVSSSFDIYTKPYKKTSGYAHAFFSSKTDNERQDWSVQLHNTDASAHTKWVQNWCPSASTAWDLLIDLKRSHLYRKLCAVARRGIAW